MRVRARQRTNKDMGGDDHQQVHTAAIALCTPLFEIALSGLSDSMILIGCGPFGFRSSEVYFRQEIMIGMKSVTNLKNHPTIHC
eukprot:767712-Hanusia_phi.AAC.2